jgi:hypothetical protein
VKPKEQKSKRTYARSELNILLLKEAFKRNLILFSDLIQMKEGFFNDSPMIPNNWTFTVITDSQGDSELFVNVPPRKNS